MSRGRRGRYARAVVEVLEKRTMLSGASLQTLYSFSGGAGIGPNSGVVVDAAGDLYGMDNGGIHGQGSLWEVEAGGTFHTLASFDGNEWVASPGQLTDSSLKTAGSPIASTSDMISAGVMSTFLQLRGTLTKTVVDSQGDRFYIGSNFFTPSAGLTVYEVSPPNLQTGTIDLGTVIYMGGTSLSSCVGNLMVDGHDNVYGVISSGGVNGFGGVFEIPAGQASAVMVASFDGTNGAVAQSGVSMDADGNLYGVTSAGGSFHSGNVYEIAAGSGVVTNVVSFQGTNGIAPKGELAIDGHGIFSG